ncbi:MAG TPA: class I SAM-dependent methyltransferase [Burkholderiaceae bacterium]
MAQMFASALGYERLVGRWSAKLAPHFTEFSGLRDCECILDVGCGTGVLTSRIAAATISARVTGVDVSEPFLAYARASVRNSRVAFERADAGALPFADATFDQSLSLLVISFLAQPSQAAGEMRRVTRPGGTVAACTWDAKGLELSSIFWQEAERLDPSAGSRAERPRHSNSQGQLEQLWRAAGLHDVVEVPLRIGTEFESFNDFWEPFLLGVGPQGVYVKELTVQRREALREALRERLLPGGSDGPISLRASAWAVRGTVPH